MASTLQKLLRKPSPLPPFRFITALNPPQPQNQNQDQNPILTLTRNPPQQCHPQPFDDAPTVIFPSLPFGFFPKPVSESGFRGGDDAGVEEDSGTLWADSVKKKRKKKMNKHKYQKLRKRMRRQT